MGRLKELFRGKHPEQEPLTGPKSHERERTPNPRDTRFTDEEGNEVPLYHVFLEDTPVTKKDAAQEAQRRLVALIEKNPEVVMSCQGKNKQEALETLLELEKMKEAA